MDRLLHKREMVMNNFMNQAVSYIVNKCLDNEIGNLVVGDWDDMKRGMKMQKKTAQQFQQIPYKKFKNKLKSKCEHYGINFVLIEESYTSRTCSGCGVIRKANRKYRGLYVCNSCGLIINADINAALNIIRKVAPKYIGGSGGMITPVRIRVID